MLATAKHDFQYLGDELFAVVFYTTMFTKIGGSNYMNIQEKNIIININNECYINQRLLSENTGISLGKVNHSLKSLINKGYLNQDIKLTDLAKLELEKNSPRNAIILAAGYGMRMIPINTEIPKGLIEVNGEVLIERIIEQLFEIGIHDITVVVGFKKEEFEYLIDRYNIKLVVNSEYALKNNLHSLALVSELIGNTYIIPCDIWCGINPFNHNELYSWYMVTEIMDDESTVRVNRKQELSKVADGGNQMIGIAYITAEDSIRFRKRLAIFDAQKKYKASFWEEVLFEDGRMLTAAKVVDSANTYEINTFEQLRELDENSIQLKSKTIDIIADFYHVNQNDVKNITVLKKGMTNRSFLFSCQGRRYIMRIPGDGTDQLINRQQEYEVYSTIESLHISDTICYINPQTGYKLTAFLEGVRVCDPLNWDDVRKCMKRLREFHGLNLHVEHTFDLFGQIELYETLWEGKKSCYRDYADTKAKIYKLKKFIDKQPKEWTLTHIDAVPDNFLFVPTADVGMDIRIIDWEYAGMQDPHVDIAMFCVYSMYEREQVEKLIDAYFTEGCCKEVRLKIYCYIAVCGLLWSNWCEFKRLMGIEFGEYSLRQYRYAKDYYQYFMDELEETI